jgi:hypothetical protein
MSSSFATAVPTFDASLFNGLASELGGAVNQADSFRLVLPIFAFAESAWSAPFFACAVAGLVSIGAMGFSGASLQNARVTRRIMPND